MAANLRPTYAGMCHVACGSVICLSYGKERKGAEAATAAFLRCVLWHASRVVSELRGNMFSTLAMAAAHQREELTRKAGRREGGDKTRLLLPLVICSTIFHYATPACHTPSALINPSPGEFTI